VLKQLKTVRNHVVTTLGRSADAKLVKAWKRIDATRPTKSIDEVSYRYPFIHANHVDGVAPAAWTGWDDCQGREQDVRDALDELLKRAGERVRVWLKQS